MFAANFFNSFVLIKSQFFGEKKKNYSSGSETLFENSPRSQEVDQAIGIVTYAGHTKVGTIRGKGYKTFSVSLATNEGEKVFHGVDLAEKFAHKCFAVGDKVKIKKSVTTFEVEFNGKKVKQKRNVFDVSVLSKA